MSTIPISSVVLGSRLSRQYGGYKNLESLAENIQQNGLIHPIVLSANTDGTYKVVAGGRRFRALVDILGVTELHHAVTSDPTRFGYLLKEELSASDLDSLLTEIAENLDRDEVDWRDELEMIVTGWKLAKYRADSNGEVLLMRNFGAMLGVSYAQVQAATAIYDDFLARPERYAQCQSIRQAYATKLKQAAIDVTKVLATKSLAEPSAVAAPSNLAQNEPSSEGPAPVVISLSNAFFNQSGIDYMEAHPNAFDHIVTDPDYAVEVDTLLSNMSGAAAGVAQSSVADSLADLRRLIPAAYNALRPSGFFIFWYDLDHHEKLQGFCRSAGFSVQRWPIIWHKVDCRSNAAPQYNFCKNVEYAMVCRKGNATLTSVQLSSLFAGPTGDVTKVLGHPFAKPFWLWRKLYTAIASPSQLVFDPCVGSGSAAIAAAQMQLRPLGCEINPDHYARLIVNLQTAYNDILKRPITFT
jgi:DNA modification methylase